jgi:hypothetical protein
MRRLYTQDFGPTWKAPRLKVAQQFEFCETWRPIAAPRASGQRKARIPGVRPARAARASPKLSSENREDLAGEVERRQRRETTTARHDQGSRSSRRRQTSATNDTANAAHAPCERSARNDQRERPTDQRPLTDESPYRINPYTPSSAPRRSTDTPPDPSAVAVARGTAPCARAVAPVLAPARPSSMSAPAPA